MILLFTDFGSEGPYQGQLMARLRQAGYEGDIFPLFSDAPVFSPKASGCLLAAYMLDFPPDSIFLSIVDPGVGSNRRALVIKACDRWFVGPDNGLFGPLLHLDKQAEIWEIIWRPDKLSASFHGRDLFAPVAAALHAGSMAEKLQKLSKAEIDTAEVDLDVNEIIYIDHYGNGMTGIRAEGNSGVAIIGAQELPLSRTFSDVADGAALAYVNANGLIEIAVNQGRADAFFNLKIGTPVIFKT
ncbi:MAG: SAM-dependent chlorinase/fluorinase [Sneathiella sp.]